MNNVVIRDIAAIVSTDAPFSININADIDLPDLTGLSRSSSLYDDITEALNRAFNPIIFGKTLPIKKVIYNGPATIILWDDRTKTVVKCKEGDSYSPEAGFALAVLKRLTGNGFHKCLRKYGTHPTTESLKGDTGK